MYNSNGQTQILTWPYIIAFTAIGTIVGAVIYNSIKKDATGFTDETTTAGKKIVSQVEKNTTQIIESWG
jgi:uncharacterized membrane protein YdjX (TVP38/TMEM64 family)